ncbi:hypothetical protein [Kamptonema animale]
MSILSHSLGKLIEWKHDFLHVRIGRCELSHLLGKLIEWKR